MRREAVLLDNMLALKTSEAGTSDSNPINTMKNNSNVISNYLQNTNPLSMRQIAEIDAQLIKMIAKEYHSMQIIEGTEFRMLLKLLNPRYNVPNRETLAKTLLPQMYEKELNIVCEKIAKTTSICFTTDAWTSITNDSYMAITAHYMGENGNLCVNLLCCVQYNERHTSINVSSFLRNELNKWNLSDKIEAVVSDNAPNIVGAINIGGWPQIGCFAHALNRVVLSGITEIQVIITKIKQVVEYFKRSSQAQIKLLEMQKQLNLPALKLKQHVITRWNSTYDMLNRIHAIKEAVIATIALIRNFHKDRETIPIIKKMVKNLNDAMRKRFYDKCNVESNKLYAEATILDPRFKKNGFSDITKYEKSVANLTS
ncbi:zinc finger BED domain-containing protein 1-like, partial [Ctenocephalides felis]|uniref:zinc finger BED domain-containing protein 1-like n=1 Tax=Ctenocephalides felis TaxID=7515 RepID=UPI000E6E251A